MAQVYLARDVRLGREVAVKVLDRRLADRSGFRERFLREARVAAALDHPNIVPLYDFGEENGILFLVMPYVSGGSLQEQLSRTPLAMSEVVAYGSQLTDALAYAHQRNLVHRDVKPANILIHGDGRLMLSDFGLAKILDSGLQPTSTRNHPDAGTPEYMAPEQIGGRTEARSDLYGLGVVLYLLMTGRLPFGGSSSNAVMEAHLYRLPESPRRLNHDVTSALELVVMQALAKRPEDRFTTASEMGAALMAALVAGDAAPLPFVNPISPLPYASLPTFSPVSSRGSAPRPGGSGSSGYVVEGSSGATGQMPVPGGLSASPLPALPPTPLGMGASGPQGFAPSPGRRYPSDISEMNTVARGMSGPQPYSLPTEHMPGQFPGQMPGQIAGHVSGQTPGAQLTYRVGEEERLRASQSGGVPLSPFSAPYSPHSPQAPLPSRASGSSHGSHHTSHASAGPVSATFGGRAPSTRPGGLPAAAAIARDARAGSRSRGSRGSRLWIVWVVVFALLLIAAVALLRMAQTGAIFTF
jgi:serine/threonine protein kinase